MAKKFYNGMQYSIMHKRVEVIWSENTPVKHGNTVRYKPVRKKTFFQTKEEAETFIKNNLTLADEMV